MDTLSTMVVASLGVEKLRVASEVKQTHLVNNKLRALVIAGRIPEEDALAIRGVWEKNRTLPSDFDTELRDLEADNLHQRLVDLEEYVDGRVGVLIKSHPAYPWFSKVKGIGNENIGKIVGLVRIRPEPGQAQFCVKCGERARDIDKTCQKCDGKLETRDIELPYADTISALWKFAGLDVQDGHSPKRREGELLSYNSQLRSMAWRVGVSLMRAGGKFYVYYSEQKTGYQERFKNSGVQIVPALKLPKVNGKKVEGDGYISELHVHNMALRKTIKLFVACLWLTWREAEGLPATRPYPIEKLGHTSFIDPWKMTDR